jgi:deazaflavin-dependent oxidoreductase (nitroreductase family)
MLPDLIGGPLRRAAATRFGARVYRAVLPPLDKAVRAATGGSHTFTELVLPTLMLHTVGRKSGLRRAQPLVYLTVGDGYAVVGTNWGQEHHPAWTHNLLAEPDAEVELKGRVIGVRARLADKEEHAMLYRRFEAVSPNYREYPAWAGDREIRLFVLDPR